MARLGMFSSRHLRRTMGGHRWAVRPLGSTVRHADVSKASNHCPSKPSQPSEVIVPVRTPSRLRRYRPFGRRDARPTPREQTGMSLVELMVAVAVLALIMSGLALSIGVDYKAVALARQRQVAEAAANKRIEELRDVDYDSMALDTQPVHNPDPTNPDYYVSTSPPGVNYDVTGTGQNEELIVEPGVGGVTHLEPSYQVGTTVVDVYQYVTWVDDPGIAGTQNLKRLSVVVQYHAVPFVGGMKFLRESVVLTNGTVALGASSITTTTSSTTTTTIPSTTTTTASTCGSFSVAGSSGGSVGYTSSTTVTITMALSTCGGNIVANFSNDGGTTWGPDVAYSSSSTNVAWTLTPGDGSKTISGRASSSSGTPWSLSPQSMILDTTAPTKPGGFARTVSCSGSTRTVTLSWTASSDPYLVGYHVYRSTDGVTWVLLNSTTGLTYTNTNSKSLTSVRYYVTAYDAAGNSSSATSTISLAKNQCS